MMCPAVTAQLLHLVCLHPAAIVHTLNMGLVLCVLPGTTVVSVFLECKQTKPSDIQVVYEIEPEEMLWFQ